MDSNAIEGLAVSAVKDNILKCPLLSPIINEMDKEASWDGSISIYDDESKKKNVFIGRLPIQVKGKVSESLDCDSITYPVCVPDLKKYCKDGGIFFFVVLINENTYERKIFYNALTPIKLRNILSKCNGQKTKSIEFISFPNTINEASTIIMNCWQNCQKQSSVAEVELKTLEDYESEGVLESIKIPFLGTGITDFKKSLVSNEVYIYAQIKGSPILHPIDAIPLKMITQETLSKTISINKKVYYTETSLLKSKDSTVFKIGDSFTI